MWQPLMSSGLTLSNFSRNKMGPRASRPGVASFAFLLPLYLPLSDISAGSLSSKGAVMLGQANLVPVLGPGGTERWKETGQETSCGRWKDWRERRREMGKRNCIYWLGARFCDLQLVMWSCEQSFVKSCSQTDVRQWWKEVFCFVLSYIQHFAHKILLEKLYMILSQRYGSPASFASASGVYTSIPNFV